MNFTKNDIDKLKQHFLAKLGGVMQGHIKVDKADTYDLGTASASLGTGVLYDAQVIVGKK